MTTNRPAAVSGTAAKGTGPSLRTCAEFGVYACATKAGKVVLNKPAKVR